MPRIDITPEDAAEIAGLCYLLEPGKKLTQAEAVSKILTEWRAARLAEPAKVAELAELPK
jgi:hypothetical protein